MVWGNACSAFPHTIHQECDCFPAAFPARACGARSLFLARRGRIADLASATGASTQERMPRLLANFALLSRQWAGRKVRKHDKTIYIGEPCVNGDGDYEKFIFIKMIILYKKGL